MAGFDKKRIQWIDYGKAIGIFLVVVGHTYGGNFLVNWIYSFHMPMFFLLSGMTVSSRGGIGNMFLKGQSVF